jgi:DHA1 family tetracycline resistance protein-like MFS transporter
VQRPLLVIFLTVLVNLLGFGIIIPLLPFYATSLGASAFTVGLLFASFSACQLVAAPILGDLSDRRGRRPVLVFSLIGTVVSFVMLALAHNVAMLFAARVIDGLSGGNISTARAYISDVTAPEDRARAFGLIGAAFGLGFVFGPALGGALSRLGYAAPAWGAAAIAGAATVLAWIWLPETAHKAAARTSPWRAMGNLLRRPAIGRLLVVDFFYWATFAVYQTTFALFGARRFGFDVAHTGYLLALFGMIGVVVQVAAVGPVVRRLGERSTLVVGLGVAGAGLAVASFVHQIVLFIATLVPAAVGVALVIPSLTSLLSRSAAADEQGRLQGVSSALEGLGRTVGPLWGNGVLGAYGEGAAFTTAAAVMLATAAVATRIEGPAGGPRGPANLHSITQR